MVKKPNYPRGIWPNIKQDKRNPRRSPKTTLTFKKGEEMIDTDKYEGYTYAKYWRMADGSAMSIQSANNNADAELMADAPLLLEFIQKIVKEWNMPNKCNQEFGKDVRQLMYEYGLITFNEETRRYEVKE